MFLNKSDVKIFISYHKPGIVLESDIMAPIHVGAKLSTLDLGIQRDDEGDNISNKNPRLCELTAQYWAWKNIDTEYYGFMHYRRHFIFEDIEECTDSGGLVHFDHIDDNYLDKIGLSDENIRKALDGVDLILPFCLDNHRLNKNKNFYIEISSDKKKENEIYYSSLLKYSVIESIGEIKVLSPELKPLPKVYVKCFCETNSGLIKFYKDGFTDLRGKFDYISLNTDLINEVKKFSILMVSKEYGSIIVSCNPPKMIKDGIGKDSIQRIFDYRQQAKNKFRK